MENRSPITGRQNTHTHNGIKKSTFWELKIVSCSVNSEVKRRISNSWEIFSLTTVLFFSYHPENVLENCKGGGGGGRIFALQKQPQLLAEKHSVWNNQKRLKFILLHYFNNQEQLFCAIETVTSWAEKGNIFFFFCFMIISYVKDLGGVKEKKRQVSSFDVDFSEKKKVFHFALL